MNWLITIAGLLGVFTVVGHFTIGTKQFLKPMLEAPFDQVPKKVMHCVFHYVSAFLIISTFFLLAAGFGIWIEKETGLLVKFISFNYAVFAAWQIAIAATSGIPNAIVRLFQWIFFVLIALFSWLGA